MDDLITNLRAKFDHPNPKKPQHSSHRHTSIIYGAKVQYAAENPTSPPLDSTKKLRIQQLVGAICYYARDIDNKLLVALIKLAQQQSSPTDYANRDMLQLLDYLATYPNNGINYRSRNMILAGHVDSDYFNVSQSRSRAEAQILLSEDVLKPLNNSPVLTIAKIIKNVMSSASDAELAGLFTITKEMVPLRQALIEMG